MPARRVGPSLADLDALRDKVTELREQDSPDQQVAGWLELLPKFVGCLQLIEGRSDGREHHGQEARR